MDEQQEELRDWTWSSSAAGSRTPVTEWSRLLSEKIAEMDVTTPEGQRFQAAWTYFDLAALELNFLKCGKSSVTRSDEMIQRGNRPYFELLYARRGRIVSDHCGLRSSTPQGGFVLLNDQMAYDLHFPDGSECLSVRMPQDWAQTWVPRVYDLVGTPVSGVHSWGRPLEGLLSAIADAGLGSTSISRATLADQIGSMFMLLGSAVPEANDVADRTLYRRIFDYLQQRFAEPDLEPEKVACDLAISKRHLHRILAREGTSFGRLLNEIRITEAERLLAGKSGVRQSIGEIAWQAGFADQSHFARLFRARHGRTPSQFRAGMCGLA